MLPHGKTVKGMAHIKKKLYMCSFRVHTYMAFLLCDNILLSGIMVTPSQDSNMEKKHCDKLYYKYFIRNCTKAITEVTLLDFLYHRRRQIIAK